MDFAREPLAVANQNVAPQRSSKLPTFSSRMPMPMKRPLPTTENAPVASEKKPRITRSNSGSSLATSSMTRSTSGSLLSSSSSSSISSSSARSAQTGSKMAPPGTRRQGIPASRSGVPPRAPAGRSNMRRSVSTSALNTKGTGLGLIKPSVLKAAANKSGMTSKSSAITRGNAPSGRSAARPATQTAATKAAPASSGGAGGGGKKRPAWDLKGRLGDMESMMQKYMAQNNELQMQNQSRITQIQQLEGSQQMLQGTVQEREQRAQQAAQQIAELTQKLRESEDHLITSQRQYQRQVDDFQFSTDTLKRQNKMLEGELSASQQECVGLKTTVSDLTSAQAGIKAQLETTQINLSTALEGGRLKDKKIAELQALLKKREETIEEQESELRVQEMERRRLHNTIQELKGNIRVFCRIRPLLGDECLGNDGVISHIGFPDGDNRELELEKLSDIGVNESSVAALRKGSNKYGFTFDRVFQPTDSQQCVFEEISQLVQSALDGYNVCIFAYGQTGSGKTFTMEGGDKHNPEQFGMIPRAVEQIFVSAAELADKGWKYEFEASFLEIYNESIRDLLGNGKDDGKHEIKMVATNSTEILVTNLTHIAVTAQDQVTNLLRKAGENRAVAETRCNERSSRSHSVFRLKISGQNEHTSDTCMGVLNLIDLAGSERLKESGSQGARLKETQCINKSLANLGNVIMALGNKSPHIPYRDSKLTYLLQNSLGGNSKTLMFVNVSPKEECFGETLNSLRFATKVNNTNIGTATRKAR